MRIRAAGFTLLELVVVLVIMGLAAALVAPTLLRAVPHRSGLGALLSPARELAARRREVVYLRIEASGQWRIDGAASAAAGPLVTGRVEPFAGVPLTLIVSPVGTCAFDVRSTAAARAIHLDPLTCTITSSS